MKRILTLALLALMTGCNGDEPGQWAAIVYPDANDLTKFQTTYGFQSHAMCKRAAMESIQSLPDATKGDYRCGFQCSPDPRAPGHPVCKSMQR